MGAKAAAAGGSGGSADAIYNQGIILWNQGKIAEAKAKFEEALKANANHAESNFQLGMALLNEGNLAGAELFGLGVGELGGRSLESLLAPASRPVLLRVLQELREGVAGASCEVQSGNGGGAQTLRVVAGAAPAGASFLLVFVPLSARKWN